MIKAILDNKLRIKKSDLTREELNLIREKFSFEIQNDMIQLYSYEDDYIALPPNPSYIDFDLDIDDRRVAPYIESPKADIVPRDHQVEWIRQLKKFDYNGIISAHTGMGKSAGIIYIQNILKTPMLFISSQNPYIISFQKELKKFYGDKDVSVRVDKDWNGEIKPFMMISVQFLNMRKDVQKKLYDSVGLIVTEEQHKLAGEQFREAIYSLNPSYRIGLSATPEVKVKNFTSAAFSPNFISSEDMNVVPMTLIPIHLQFSPEMDIMGGDFMSRKKNYMNNKSFVSSLSKAVSHIVKDRGRGCLVYNDLNSSQETYKKSFEKLGLKTKVVNKDTSNSEVGIILEEFEKGLIDVLVSGKSLVEGISLYRLSVIIITNQLPANSQGGKNSLIQLVGRNRRKNDEVCNHKKIVIDLIFSSFEKYYESRKPVYKAVEGLKFVKELHSENTDFDHILKRMG